MLLSWALLFICPPFCFRIPYGFSLPSYNQKARVYLSHWAAHSATASTASRAQRQEIVNTSGFGPTLLKLQLQLMEKKVPLRQRLGSIKLSLLQSDTTVMQLLGDRGIGDYRRKKNKIGYIRTPPEQQTSFLLPKPEPKSFWLLLSLPQCLLLMHSVWRILKEKKKKRWWARCWLWGFWILVASCFTCSYLLFRVFKLLFHAFCPDTRDSLEHA